MTTIASMPDAIALVSQDVTLFNESVRANIALGRLKCFRKSAKRFSDKKHGKQELPPPTPRFPRRRPPTSSPTCRRA